MAAVSVVLFLAAALAAPGGVEAALIEHTFIVSAPSWLLSFSLCVPESEINIYLM